MQNVKDSFFNALHDRLAALNPLRTVVIEGVIRPAVIVVENELATTVASQANAFYLKWKDAVQSKSAIHLPQPLIELGCQISYWTEGSDSLSYQDRGRLAAALDDELVSITVPGNAKLQDFSLTPAVDLSAMIFWSAVELGELNAEGRKQLRAATIRVFYLSEVTS